MTRLNRCGSRIMTDKKIDEYCRWMEECEKSKLTIRRYRYQLSQFKEFTGGRPVSKAIVMCWKEQQRGSWEPVTVNSAIAALNGFFRHYGWLDCTLRFLKVSRNSFLQEDRELSKEEYFRLVESALSGGNNRLALILETLCSCGIRISELAFITMEAVRKGRAEAECKGRIRTVLLPSELCDILKEYAEKKGITEGMIFVTRTGKAVDRSNVWREMKALSGTAKVGKEKIFPHNLRHLFARTYYAARKDLAKLADILGHRDVNTTRIYTMENGSEHRWQIESLKLLRTPYNRISLLL